jgi:hypothetical protein
MTEKELLTIERRCDSTTRGPWKSLIENRDHEAGDSFIMTGVIDARIFGAMKKEKIFIL